MKSLILILTLFAFSIGCSQPTSKTAQPESSINMPIFSNEKEAPDTLTAKFDKGGVNDSFLLEKEEYEKQKLLLDTSLHYRIKELLNDTSVKVLAEYLLERQDKEGYKIFGSLKDIGDIDNDKIRDTVIVVPELLALKDEDSDNVYYEEGASFVFTNRKLPKIKVDALCVSCDYIFPIGDIDEDGIMELGQYYSSCSSRLKVLLVLHLENGVWKEIAQCLYDTSMEVPHFSKRIKKLKRGLFQMDEITLENKEQFGNAKRVLNFKLN